MNLNPQTVKFSLIAQIMLELVEDSDQKVDMIND